MYVCAHTVEVRRDWDPLEQESQTTVSHHVDGSEQILGPPEEEPVYLTTELSLQSTNPSWEQMNALEAL